VLLIKHNHNPNPVRLLKLKNKTTQFFTNFARNKRITQYQNSMYKKITFLLLITILVSCKNADADDSDKNEKDKIRTAHWLIGSWEFKSTDGILSENWKKLNDSTYKGESYFIKGTDTLHCETITLQQKEEDLSYLTTIIGQNNDEPICTGGMKRYPEIIYNHLSKDSLVTEISGLQSGKPSSEKYLMKVE
jgi:hypothetical protein